jgi:hypothetical protein
MISLVFGPLGIPAYPDKCPRSAAVHEPHVVLEVYEEGPRQTALMRGLRVI